MCICVLTFQHVQFSHSTWIWVLCALGRGVEMLSWQNVQMLKFRSAWNKRESRKSYEISLQSFSTTGRWRAPIWNTEVVLCLAERIRRRGVQGDVGHRDGRRDRRWFLARACFHCTFHQHLNPSILQHCSTSIFLTFTAFRQLLYYASSQYAIIKLSAFQHFNFRIGDSILKLENPKSNVISRFITPNVFCKRTIALYVSYCLNS